MVTESPLIDDGLIEECGHPCAYSTSDGTSVITMEDFVTLATGEREFNVLCKDCDQGILPFLVAEEGSTDDAIFGNADETGLAHVDSRLPVPSYFGLANNDDYLEMSPRGMNGGILLRRFHWCVLMPFEEDPTGGTYELRFATTTRADAEFVAEELGGNTALIASVLDVVFDVI